MKKRIPLLVLTLGVILSCNDEPTPPQLSTPQLSISGFEPSSGAFGTEVTITGTLFSKILTNNTVSFNNVIAIVSSATATELKVEVPNRAGIGAIKVEVDGNTTTSQSDFIYIKTYQEVTTLAGSTSGFVDGQGTEAMFTNPVRCAIDASGNLFVADAGNNAIRKITPGGLVSTLAGGSSGVLDGQGSAAQFNSPSGIAVDAAGNLFVADAGNHRIRKITSGGLVTTLAGETAGAIDGQGNMARFDGPSGVALDGSGNIYVADGTSNLIRKVSAGGSVSTWAGGPYMPGFIDGQGALARFNRPYDLVLDHQGNVFVSDRFNYSVRKITPGGLVTTFAGTGSVGYVDGDGLSASFTNSRGIAADENGNLFITDAFRVRKITSTGSVSTIAGTSEGSTDGLISMALFSLSLDVGVDSNGNIYVVDTSNHRIRKITFE